MSKTAEPMEKAALIQKLQIIGDAGFRNDLHKLVEDLCRQFPDRKFFIKEYVVNAADAKATRIIITASLKDGYITVNISDNGNGMNRAGVIDFFGIFKSSKTGDKSTAGQFGIGKLSVAAIPNQTGFEMITSTGKECWSAETGALSGNGPIRFSRLETVPAKGTMFKITYKLETSLKTEMETLHKILSSSVSFLSPEIIVIMPDPEEEGKNLPVVINKEWPGDAVHFHRTFKERIGGELYTITLGLGKTFHGIYQNFVFITDKYNLLQPASEISVYGLCIMVESAGFKLPFGRHKIQNEEVLGEISYKVQKLLPGFYSEVFALFKRGNLCMTRYEFDLFTADLVYHFNRGNQIWLHAPVFKGVNENAFSFAELHSTVQSGQFIYIADPALAGIDFSKYRGLVISNEQNGKCIKIVKEHFAGTLYDLNDTDLLMEETEEGSSAVQLSHRERKFQQHLGFQCNHVRPVRSPRNSRSSFQLASMKTEGAGFKSDEKTIRSANQQLEAIRWRVSRLIERDTAPCRTRMYMFDKKQNTIILNLYHARIAELVGLSDINPALAAHFAMALALLDKQNILPHIEPETRESLLLYDAISRVNGRNGGYDVRDDFRSLLYGFEDDLN